MSLATRIRVIHILTKPELGGAQANTLHTVRHLDRERFAPGLITSPSGPLAADMAEVPDATCWFVDELVRELRPARDWQAGRRIADILRRTRPDVVHTHSSKAGMLGRWAARRAAVPVVIHSVHGFPFHDYMPAPRRSLYRALERAAARLTDRFICVSRADIAKGVAAGVFREQDAELIRSGIELAPYRRAAGSGAAVRSGLGIPADVPLAGMVACLKPQKDPLAFVAAAAAVRKRVPDAWFLLVGDGQLRPAVAAAVSRLGLADRLVLAGWRRDIPAVMDALDVLVLTSLHEGLPRVIPEAMASGRPVVATAVDGSPEAVAEGETGHLVPPRDPEAVAARTAALLADPARARRMGAAARERVAEWDIDEMVRRQERLYERLLAGRAREAA
jgi:glycosyltransferase involved in cell wall biosynthesis